MGEITIPCIDNKCAVEGADVADRSCRDNNAPSGLEDEQNGSQNASNRDHNSDSITGTSTSSNLARDVGAEGSEAVRLLDEELEELEKLISLQRRRIDALERLRRQWISGERCSDNRIYYFLFSMSVTLCRVRSVVAGCGWTHG